ncbi:MAG: ABC transporter ATP-binding protein [Chloroflexi bacterium]|nr:ABC transporter ATP-binding protein [Chloroflexota bacterium]
MMWRGGGGGGLGFGHHVFSDDEALGKVYDHRVVMRLLRYVGTYKLQTIISTWSVIISSLTSVATPWIIKHGIDKFVGKGDLVGLNWVALLFVVNALLNWGSNYVQFISMAKVSQGVLYNLRTEMFHHLQRLSLSFFDRTEVGRIMSRVQNDVNQLQEFLSVVIQTLGDSLSLVGIVVALLLLNLKLGLLTMTVIPVLFGIMMIWQRHARSSFMRVRGAISAVNGALQENISGVRVVQSFSRESRNLHLFDRKNYENLEANLHAGRLSAILMPVVDILTAVSIGLVIVFGSQMVASGALEIGALVAFIMYIQRFFDPIRNLTLQYTQFQRAMTSGVRIFELLDVPPDLKDAPNAKELPPLKGEIRFEGVTFAYTKGQDVLKDINLHIRPGETVALVGPTGAGKTTLVSLTARFYDVQAGRITVDGYGIRDVTRRSLANQMSMVLQEPFLFSGTVKENIRYNHLDASDEDIERAARAVGAHDFIMRMEKGYDTVLQERGLNLSVGQRQLVSFARAIIANPRIIILDEATANIDSYTEMLIQQALKELLEGRTAIVIAHRLSTIRNADKIVVMDRGQIVAVGKHHGLVKECDLYNQLYAMNYAALETAGATAGNGGS